MWTAHLHDDLHGPVASVRIPTWEESGSALGRFIFFVRRLFERFERGHGTGGVVDTLPRLWAPVEFGGGIMF